MKNILAPLLMILLFMAIMGIQGCEMPTRMVESPVSFYKSGEYNNSYVQRVLLVPFTYETGREKVVKEVTEAFFVELQKNAKYDVVMPHEFHEAFLKQDDLWVKGLVRPETIIEAKKRYQVDAIMFGTITHYKPYEPPVLGIKMSMFSTTSGNVIWNSDTIFDSSEATITKLAKIYYKENFQEKQSLYGWKLILLSSERYAQFIAHHVVATL